MFQMWLLGSEKSLNQPIHQIRSIKDGLHQQYFSDNDAIITAMSKGKSPTRVSIILSTE